VKSGVAGCGGGSNLNGSLPYGRRLAPEAGKARATRYYWHQLPALTGATSLAVGLGSSA